MHSSEQGNRPHGLSRCVRNNQSAQQVSHARANVDAHRVDAKGRSQPLARKIIGDQRIGRRGKRCFSHADAHAQQKHCFERFRHSATGCEPAPQYQAGRDDQPAAVNVGQPAERDSEECIKQCEAESDQQTHLSVADV